MRVETLPAAALIFCSALSALAQDAPRLASTTSSTASAAALQPPSISFLPSVAYSAQNGPAAVAAADFDGDGKADLAVANVASSSLSVLFGNGDGTFEAASNIAIPGGCTASYIGVAKLLHNDRTDILTVCAFQRSLWVVPGLGNRTFGTPIKTSLPLDAFIGFAEVSISPVAFADFNADGNTDFTIVLSDLGSGIAGATTTGLYLLRGNGDGTFQPATAIAGLSDAPGSVATGDFNQDGNADLAVLKSIITNGGATSSVVILLGAGNGTFTNGGSYATPVISLIGTIVAADATGDGVTDLLVSGVDVSAGSTVSSAIQVFKGRGDGTFQQASNVSRLGFVYYLTVGNFRGTGVLDLLTGVVNESGSSSSLVVFPGNGDGTFGSGAAQPLNSLTLLPYGIVATDLNGDGLPDIAAPALPVSLDSLGNGGDGSNSADIVAFLQQFPAGSVTVLLNSTARSGSMAQIASAGTWDTGITLLNLGKTSSAASLGFFGDPSGAALSLPFTFPQTGSGPSTSSTITQTINPNAQLVLDTTGPSSQNASIGWSLLQTPGDVTGFAVFADAFFGWNAVVPLETRSAPSYLLLFDNTGALTTGVAIANLSQPASIQVVFKDDTGAQIGTDTLALGAQGHTTFMLSQKYAFTVGKRGTVQFITPPGGQISVLGLRANGTSALTTLPVLASVAPGGGSITHATYNGGFTSVFYIVNTGTASAGFTLTFFDENGNPLAAPLLLPQSGATTTTSALTRTLAPGAMLVIETQAQDALASVVGSAQLTTTGNISGFEVFRWTTFNQEASVPVETRAPNGFVLVFDDTNSLTTGVALANQTNAAANIVVQIYDDAGVLLQTAAISLAARGHTSFLLPTNFAITTNKRGMAEFVVPVGGKISAVGLRAKTDGTLTTIPVLVR